MAGINKAIILGNIGKVDIRATKDGGQVVSISATKQKMAMTSWSGII